MSKSRRLPHQVSDKVKRERGADRHAPVALLFRTWGIDLHKARYDMPPRLHTLTKRILHKLLPHEIFKAHQGMSLAAMQRAVPMAELRLMLVKQQRLMLEMVERVLTLTEVPYVVTLDEGELEPWMTGEAIAANDVSRPPPASGSR